jgi:hypothetical protein
MAQKLTKKQWWMVIGSIVVILLIVFAIRYYRPPAMSDVPLYSTEERITLEVEELKEMVDSMISTADQTTSEKISKALADNYLSTSEENKLPGEISSELEILNSNIKYPAVVSGFTFSLGNNRVKEVKGYKYGVDRIKSKMEEEFQKKGTAVKERELIEKLNSLISQNTRDDKLLDSKEKNIILNMITSPEPGKKSSLPASTANQIIDQYCRNNSIVQGEK